MKKIIGIVLLLLAIVAISVVVTWTNGFTDFEIKEMNPDNLLTVAQYDENLDAKRTDGLKVEVDDDGIITVEGENETEADVEITVQTVTLAKGTYTISSSARGADDKTYYLCIRTGEGDTATTIIADDGEDSTFEVEAEATYTVYIVVCAGEELDVTFKPVLVEGEEEGRFYIIG